MRENLARQVGGFGGDAARVPVPETDAWRLDRLASELVRARQTLSLPLTRCARAFVLRKAWFHMGYARVSDLARERLGRSGRWVRDLAALGEALARLPGLARALCGDDGGPPIGRVAAELVGRCATEETLDDWVALARRIPIRELRGRVREALAAGEGGMPGDGSRAPECVENEEPNETEDTVQVVLRVSPLLRAAFDEAHRLYEAVEGQSTTRASFIEALVGEASAGPGAPEFSPPEPRPPHGAWDRARIERYLADVSGFWMSLEARGRGAPAGPEVDLARAVLHRARFLRRHAGEGDAAELDEQLRALIALENDLERALGALLARMAERREWSALRFSGVGHYGEQRLGMSRSAAESRAWIARMVSRSAALKESYESGRLGHEAVLLLGRLFAELDPGAQEQATWVKHAEEITIRRLRDEAARAMRLNDEFRRARSMAAVAEESRAAISVATDAQWRSFLERVPGQSRERVRRLCGLAVASPDVFPGVKALVALRLRLPRDLAAAFQGLVANRGLASILLEFVEVWDGSPPRASDRVYVRDGWRCTAPGCSSRRNLEDHHIRYRSQGGDDSLGNRTCLCRFHHQQGEHGGLMRVKGTAPLGMKWVLGLGGKGGRFENDRAI